LYGAAAGYAVGPQTQPFSHVIDKIMPHAVMGMHIPNRRDQVTHSDRWIRWARA
jgi:hypothetical protein